MDYDHFIRFFMFYMLTFSSIFIILNLERSFILENILNKRKYNFSLLIYDDFLNGSSINDLINDLYDNYSNFDYCYIHHYLDLFDDLTKKKPHYHLNLYFKNATTINHLSNYLYLDPKFIEIISSPTKMDRYLTHIDFKDKIQYPFENIHFNKNYRRKLYLHYDILSRANKEDLTLICDYILECKNNLRSYGAITLAVINFVEDNDLSYIYRKYKSFIDLYIKENL